MNDDRAEYGAGHGALAPFTRCGERVQGPGGRSTCGDVIDSFVAEVAPDEHGAVRDLEIGVHAAGCTAARVRRTLSP